MSKSNETSQAGSKAWKIPCFPCENLDKCGVGQDQNPIECIRMNTWILNRGIIEEVVEEVVEDEIKEETE
ncbi:MAG: hypothetical protein ACFFDT_38250 [Candidatus Hodarchaeota archaeon]